MSSVVYFASNHCRSKENNKCAKVERLCAALNLKDIVKHGEPCGIKLHFGEYGNDTHIKPMFVRTVVDQIKNAGAKPFLTDSCTLYSGMRHNAVDHLNVAYLHGFSPSTVGAPIIIADGLLGKDDKIVEINCKNLKQAHIANAVYQASSLVVMSHFKGHEMAGFGGAIKNLAMGGASIEGKTDQHGRQVIIDQDKCVGCGKCVSVCPQHALSIVEKKSHVDKDKCIGCFECITVCPTKSISIDWSLEYVPFVERLTEYAYAVVKDRQKNICYINFVVNVTPDCDCVAWSDAPMVADIGILASHDPVALDQACYDLVNQAEPLDPKLKGAPDKFKARWPHTEGAIQLSYGEKIGLGSREYELKRI